MNWLRLGTMPLEDAKTLVRLLATRGVEAVMDHNTHTCTRGCSVTVEVLVPEAAVAVVQATLKEQYEKLAAGLAVDWARLGAVFDPRQSEATCPACGQQFSTERTECPQCGLCFS